MNQGEQIIIEQLRKANEKAYKYLYDHHYEVLCRIAYRYVADASLAEMIVEDVIVHLWEKREELEIRISLRSYLIAAVRNRCLSYLESSENRREISFSNLGDSEKVSIGNMFLIDHQPMDEEQLVDLVQNAIDNLPFECRNVFVRSRVDEMTYEEIAKQLEISVNTVKYHMKNALKSLREELGPYLSAIIFLNYFEF